MTTLQFIDEVVVALIGLTGVVAVAWLNKRNTKQHNDAMDTRDANHREAMEAIGGLHEGIGRVEYKIDAHLKDHERSNTAN